MKTTFIELYMRGLVFGIMFFIVLAIVIGFGVFAVNFPHVGLPVLFLLILPIMFGIMTED